MSGDAPGGRTGSFPTGAVEVRQNSYVHRLTVIRVKVPVTGEPLRRGAAKDHVCHSSAVAEPRLTWPQHAAIRMTMSTEDALPRGRTCSQPVVDCNRRRSRIVPIVHGGRVLLIDIKASG